MEENKVLIDLAVYNRLLLAEASNEYIKTALFDKDYIRLAYGGEELLFEPSVDIIKNLYPVDYNRCLNKLIAEKENKDV